MQFIFPLEQQLTILLDSWLAQSRHQVLQLQLALSLIEGVFPLAADLYPSEAFPQWRGTYHGAPYTCN